jgi:hypothetical protein
VQRFRGEPAALDIELRDRHFVALDDAGDAPVRLRLTTGKAELRLG